MTDLDQKLREIVSDASTIGAGMDDFGALDQKEQDKQIDGTVAEIKQAFADEGYVHPVNLPEGTQKVTVTYEGKQGAGTTLMMTGQEFYDRFEQELDPDIKATPDVLISLPYKQVFEAAKRAAGIE